MSGVEPARWWTGSEPGAADEPTDENGGPLAGEPFADAIVVAAGSSSRMGGLDKLDAVVNGLPLLAHAVRAIAAAPEVRRIVIVTTGERIEAFTFAAWLPSKVALAATGGRRRQDSVRTGFEHLLLNKSADGDRDPEVVLVHDGARPLVPTALVSAVARAARLHGAAIPVVAVGDTIKRIDREGSVVGAGDRSTLGAAQTPQGFRTELLRQAYERIPADTAATFTDEAALLEACKLPVHAIPGDERNLKVTVPGDLARVATLLGGQPATEAARPAARIRVGFGTDSHPFGPAMSLALGGLVVDGAPRLHGHSDGDVLLHAIADALLGAAGLGDLGRLFPAGPETPVGIASTELIAEVMRGVTAAGYVVANLDCTIVAGRPRLGPLLPSMGARIAGLLAIEPTVVNIKASSGNLDGMEGAGRGISANAIVVLTGRPDGP
ncbi:MAG: 2-C-methyl-D-erythritol 4-phosphate cytidylyltransferase [Chloroflexota bacterium]|nr:2-C-methyl-D-erythritol 4-phosphate cytidylyltransferase [Chloroflexota bacterium]